MPIITRARLVRDMHMVSSQLEEIVSMEYLRREMKCSSSEMREAVKRAKQLYGDIRR